MGRLCCVLVALIFVAGIGPDPECAEPMSPYRNPMVIKVIPLQYADAENLASVLRPLLTKDGTIVADAPTNTLIIKDRRSLVGKLARVIKGPDKAEDHFLNFQDGCPASE
ncbi:MAG: secretin N-terminal domain-containing protein [Thermodesulfobacteriota bacterium]|nr:secretin N-terminal domain-containing protein [Thermodesulfobacteriota bacterium]